MNVDWQFGDDFCDSCAAKLTANRNKWKDHYLFVDEEAIPPNRDEWTEPSEDPPEGWTSYISWNTISRSTDAYGTQYSIEGYCSGTPERGTTINLKRGNLGDIPCYYSADFKKLNFHMKWTNSLEKKPWYLMIFLYTSTPNHLVRATLYDEVKFEADTWELISLPLGPEATAPNGDYSKTWEEWYDWVDSDWKRINKIDFDLGWKSTWGVSGGDGTFRFDMLYFSRNNGDLNLTEGIFHRLPEGKPVTVMTQPHTGFAFDYWVIDGSQTEGNPANLLMDQNHTVEPHFIKKLDHPKTRQGPLLVSPQDTSVM